MRRPGKRSGAVLALLLALGASPAAGQERQRALQLSGGVFNVGKTPTQAEVGIELRRPIRLWRLDLAAGAAATEEGSFWGYLGLRKDLRAGEKLVVAPGFGVAGYRRGDGKELGGSLQFRSAIDFGYQITRGTRVGLTLYHLSNAGLEELNPGANSAVLTYSIALR